MDVDRARAIFRRHRLPLPPDVPGYPGNTSLRTMRRLGLGLLAGVALVASAVAQPAPVDARRHRLAAHRARAVRRRRPWHRARRRSEGPRGTAGAGALRRRHQHGGDRRRHLRGRPFDAGNGDHRARGRLGGDLPRQAAAPRDRGPPQDRRLQAAVRLRSGAARRVAGPAQGPDRRRVDRVLLPRDDTTGRRDHRLRQAAGAVSRRGHGPRDGHRGGARAGQPRAGAARQHVGAGSDRTGRDRRPPAGRRRPGGQPADRRGAPTLRRRRHRRQHLHAAAAARPDHVGAQRHGADDQLHRSADRQGAAEEPDGEGRADRAGTRQPLGVGLRSFERRHPHRRGGDARDGRRSCGATACRQNATPRCARVSWPRPSRTSRSTRSASRA